MVYYHVSCQLKQGEVINPEQKSFRGWSEFAFKTIIHNYTDFDRVYNYLGNSSVRSDTDRSFVKWLCETLFESIRQQRYPGCPTRIYGTFLCKDIDESRKFNNEWREGKGTIFVVHTQKPVDFFKMQLFTDAEKSLYGDISESVYKGCVEKAIKYWDSKNNESIDKKEYICLETLLLSDVVK